jgi:carbon storage regulator
MLIISRKPGEKITIGDDTVITLVEIKDNHVRLGIDAPRHISVHRQEVYDRIKRANLASSGIDVSQMRKAMAVFKIDRADKEQN